jgi:hypothetical protein
MGGMGVGQGNEVQAANASSPKSLRDNFFADVEVLRRLMRAAAETSTVDEKRFPIRCNQQQ